jgi:cobalt-zinc-cadmium efflux system outer membrane protein
MVPGKRRLRPAVSFVFAVVVSTLGGRPAEAQVSLADDIIAAATQGKENAKQRERSRLGPAPGTTASPYRRSPGSTDVILGGVPNRRLAPLPRLSRRPSDASELALPTPDRHPLEHGLAPSVERLRLPEAPPPTGPGNTPDSPGDLDDEQGPAGGLDLDEAIRRLIQFNRDLRSKSLEIPQAEADVLTAGLRENPLLFYSSGSVPYGSYSPRRPGDINHGLSLVYPLDYSGKRRTRTEVARNEKCVLEAQYGDAVRLELDNLYTAFVDVLAARQAAQASRRGLGLIDRLAVEAGRRGGAGPTNQEALDDLTIERDLAAMSIGDEQARLEKAKRRLAVLLEIPPAEVAGLEVRGSLRVLDPLPPPVEALVEIALAHRPDLEAHRRGLQRAKSELGQERAERFSDAYLLYTPFEYRDNSQSGQLSSTTWGAGVFVSAPLFNRNQGNLRRARLNIDQSYNELAAVERRVVAEVTQASRDLENTRDDTLRLEQVTLPAVRRKRDRAWARLRAGEIDEATFLAVQRDTTALVRYHRETLVRHRRNTLKINTAVGQRIMP